MKISFCTSCAKKHCKKSKCETYKLQPTLKDCPQKKKKNLLRKYKMPNLPKKNHFLRELDVMKVFGSLVNRINFGKLSTESYSTDTLIILY